MMDSYTSFLAAKKPRAVAVGLSDPPALNPALFDEMAA